MTAIEYSYLTETDKQNIIESHIKALEHSLYNVEISKVEATASGLDASTYDAQITDFQTRIAALEEKLSALDGDI